MSAAALDQLIACEEAFIATLDGNDVGALEIAAGRLGEAVALVAAEGAWRAERELGARIVQALRLVEAARARINYLADMNRRRLEKLSRLSGAPVAHAYTRADRLG